MKNSKVLSVLIGATILLTSAGAAFASPFDFSLSHQDCTDTSPVVQTFSPFYNPGSNSLPVFIGNDCSSGFQNLNIGSGIGIASGNIFVTPNTIETPDGFLTDTLNLKASTASLSSLSASLVSLATTVAGLGTPVNIPAFMGNNASTTPFVASSTQNGFFSSTDKVKLDSLSNTWTSASNSRSIVTGTGATGFQVSSARNSSDKYTVKVTTTASITGNADGYIALEVAPTNSATSTDWIEEGRCGNSQALTLAITLQSVQGTTCQLSADIPAGYFAKLRSVITTGTVTFASVSSRETLK